MAKTVFDADQATLDTLEQLKVKFGASSSADVLNKAIQLARFAAQNADADNTITLVAPGGDQKKVILSQ